MLLELNFRKNENFLKKNKKYNKKNARNNCCNIYFFSDYFLNCDCLIYWFWNRTNWSFGSKLLIYYLRTLQMFEIKKAERKQLKARIWFFWNSWSWKTLWSLLFGYWLAGEDWSKICVIDTEYWRSEAYADRWEFSVLSL